MGGDGLEEAERVGAPEIWEAAFPADVQRVRFQGRGRRAWRCEAAVILRALCGNAHPHGRGGIR